VLEDAPASVEAGLVAGMTVGRRPHHARRGLASRRPPPRAGPPRAAAGSRSRRGCRLAGGAASGRLLSAPLTHGLAGLSA
jgi:hypothetical protein